MATVSGVENFMAMNPDIRMPNGLNPYGHGDSNTVRSPLHMNLGFFKNLSEKKTAKGERSDPVMCCQAYRILDGQTPKRRGPKPDSKPALTRRQELNRQAQRSVSFRPLPSVLLADPFQYTSRTERNIH